VLQHGYHCQIIQQAGGSYNELAGMTDEESPICIKTGYDNFHRRLTVWTSGEYGFHGQLIIQC
jgi:hypothetical protein